MLVWLLLCVPAVWYAVFRYRRRNMYKLAAPIPGADSELPFVGITHKLIGSNEDILASLQEFSYDAMKHNGIMKGWLGHILYFVLINPVDLEVVMKTCMEKDDLHRFMRKVIGYGGIFAPVPIWRRRRKIMVPAFSPKIIENFVHVFSEQSEKLSKRLTSTVGNGRFSIWPYLSTYTLDSVCETAMGVKINAQGNPDNVFLKSLNRILVLLTARIFHLWLQPDWLYKIFPQYQEHQKCIKAMHAFTDDVIEKKRDEIEDNKLNKTNVENAYGFEELDLKKSISNGIHLAGLDIYRSKTFLDLLVSLSGGDKGYTNVELREEILTLTIAGTDTSAVAVGYTMILLGKYPEIQEKVYQELQDVFGDTDRPLDKEDLVKLKYLERVVKESLRLFPPVPFVIRKVLEDITLPSGRVLPAGSGIVVSIWGAHRDPQYWGAAAEHFDPDRFLPERFTLANTCSYMPFSSGPRNCPGYQYALMSIKTALSSILRRYKVVGEPENGPIPKIKVKLDIMMKSVEGFQVALERRTRGSSSAQG